MVKEVEVLVEGAVGNVSRNTYFAVDTANPAGLPATVRAGLKVYTVTDRAEERSQDIPRCSTHHS